VTANLRRGLALAAGLCLWLSFPNPWALHFEAWTGRLAWLALAPLLVAVDGADPRTAFRLGYLVGLACFVPGLEWLTRVEPLGGGAWPAWLALAAWCALFPAIFGAAAARGLRDGWSLPALWLPALWTLAELLRERLLGGIPWIGLGSSQFNQYTVLPLAAALGQAGLHYAVALGGTVVYGAFWRPKLLMGAPRSLSVVAMALGLAGLAAQQASAQRAWEAASHGPVLRTAVIQGNIDLDQPWTRAYRRALMDRYLGLSAKAADEGARLLLWPESAFPGFFNEGSVEAQALRDFVKRRQVTVLCGSTLSMGGHYTNGAVWVSPDGEGSYAKRHLVPFGEYVPFRDYVPLLDLALARAGVVGFDGGQAPALFERDGIRVKPLICYESIFPALARSGLPTDLLAVLTVDTWYGRTAGPVWHASQAALRAVEQGCWVGRAASTGISLFAGPDGRIRATVGLDETGYLIQDIPKGRPTPFQRWGQGPVLWTCLLLLLTAFVTRKKG
jgi:apolipoprotein N-acyltransferase